MRYVGVFAEIHGFLSCVQLVKILNRSKWELESQGMEDLVRSQARVAIGVDASSLFSNIDHMASAPLHKSFHAWYGRLQGVRVSSFSLRHSFQVTNGKPLLTIRHTASRGL